MNGQNSDAVQNARIWYLVSAAVKIKIVAQNTKKQMKKRCSASIIVSCNTETWAVYCGDSSCEGRGQGGGGEPRLGTDHIYVPQETQHTGTPAQGGSDHGQQATRTVSAFAFYSKGINRPGSFQQFLSSWRITFYWVILRHRTGFWCGCFIFVPLVPALYRGSELEVDWSGFMIWIIENISKSKLFVEERDRETWVALIILSWPNTPPTLSCICICM